MKKEKSFFTEYKDKIWFAAGLNLLLLMILLIWMRPVFETNDDLSIIEFFNGSRGLADAHSVYTNVILGCILCTLYRISVMIPWYMILQYLVLFLGFTMVSHIILKRSRGLTGLWISIVLFLFFGYEVFIRVQYTKTAGVLAGMAVIGVADVIAEKNTGWKRWILSYLLGWIGSMYRFPQFFACLALASGIGVLFLLTLIRQEKTEAIQKTGKIIGGFAGLILGVFLLFVIDQISYREADLKEYVEYNNVRTELLDYGFPDYEQNRSLYEQLDLNPDAWALYTSWCFYDPDKFTVDAMKQLAAVKEKKRIDGALIKSFVKECIPGFLHTTVFGCVILMGILWLMAGRRRWIEWVVLLYEGLLFGAFYFYLYYQGRYLYNRVDVGLWFSIICVFIWMLIWRCGEDEADTYGYTESRLAIPAWIRNAIGCILLILITVFLQQNTWNAYTRKNTQESRENMAQRRMILEQAGNDKEHLYLDMTGTLSGGASYGPWDLMPDKILDNVNWFGGWPVNARPSLSVYHRYGVENPYRDMIDNEKVYLTDYHIDLTLNYLREYYDPNADAKQVGEIGGVPIYQVTTK